MGKGNRIGWRHFVQDLTFGGDMQGSVEGFVLDEGMRPRSLRDRGEHGLLMALAPLRDLDDATGAYDAWRPREAKRSGTAVLLVVPAAPGVFYWYFVGLNHLRPLGEEDMLRAIDPQRELRSQDGGWNRSAVHAVSKAMVDAMATMAAQRWPSWTRSLKAKSRQPIGEGVQP